MANSATRWRALIGLMRPLALRWTVVVILVVVGAGGAVLGPLVLAEVVDDIGDGADVAAIRRSGMVLVGLAVGTLVATLLAIYMATAAAWRTTNQLRSDLTRHVLDLDLEFHRSHSPGEMISRVDGDVTAVSDFLGNVMVTALRSIALVLGAIVVLFVRSWPIAIAFAAYVALALAATLAVRHRAIAESADEMGANAALYGGIEERLNASVDLRSNGGGDYAMHRFIGESRDVLASARARAKAFLVMWWVVMGAVGVGMVVSLVAGALLVTADWMSVGEALLVFQFVLLTSRPLEDLVHQLQLVQKANAGMARVVELMATHSTMHDDGDTSPDGGALSIDIDDVSFDYGDDQAVLRHVNSRIEAGRSVGIVGRTGSGKTTFSRLVLRLVDATEGVVRLGGVPIAEIPLSEVRRRVTLIPQEVELFGASVRDNITLFDAGPTDAAVEEALRAVGLQRLVDGGIDRELGPSGAGLSAGEAQLMSLARAWLRSPDLIVLDEPTARVDPETDAAISRAVGELARGRTTLIIAHRLDTLDTLDEIMVFKGGRLIEHGGREQLAASRSRYAALLDATSAAEYSS